VLSYGPSFIITYSIRSLKNLSFDANIILHAAVGMRDAVAFHDPHRA